MIPVRPHIGMSFDFAAAPAALATIQSGATTGKLVLHCNA
ncbi:MAG: zinc-binding dehydrogenase [Phycisphaerae bacterium]